MWIVTGTENDLVKLVSSKETEKILPIGSYLTVIDETNVKHILAVEKSFTKSLFEPSPLIVDAELPLLKQDQECKNIILAREIRQFTLGQMTSLDEQYRMKLTKYLLQKKGTRFFLQRVF
jgi:hypothetical protein